MLALLLFILVGFLIVGCSSNKEVDNTSSEGNDTTSENSNSSESTDPGTVELIWISQQNDERTQPVIDAFEEANPNIKIKKETYPFRQLFETIEVKLGSKTPDVDIIDVDVPLVANYAVKGYLEPLDNYLDPDIKSKWIDSAVEAGSFQGQLVAPPINTSSQVLYYNKTIFEEKGIAPPPNDIEQRWTWDQVVETAQKLTSDNNGDGQTDVFGFSFEQISRPYQILPLPQGLGADQFDEKGIVTDGYTNSALSVEAGQFYYDLYNTWNVSPKIPVEQAKEYFTTGKIAMFIGGTWNVGDFAEADLDYGFAPHPYFEGGEVVTPTGSWHLGVSKNSTKKEAAAKFVEFFTAGDGAKIWFESANNLPAHVDILNSIEEDPKFAEFPANINVLAAYEAANTAVPRPMTPGYLEWESLVNKAYEDIKNGSDPKDALDTAIQQIDRQLKKYESVVK